MLFYKLQSQFGTRTEWSFLMMCVKLTRLVYLLIILFFIIQLRELSNNVQLFKVTPTIFLERVVHYLLEWNSDMNGAEFNLKLPIKLYFWIELTLRWNSCGLVAEYGFKCCLLIWRTQVWFPCNGLSPRRIRLYLYLVSNSWSRRRLCANRWTATLPIAVSKLFDIIIRSKLHLSACIVQPTLYNFRKSDPNVRVEIINPLLSNFRKDRNSPRVIYLRSFSHSHISRYNPSYRRNLISTGKLNRVHYAR